MFCQSGKWKVMGGIALSVILLMGFHLPAVAADINLFIQPSGQPAVPPVPDSAQPDTIYYDTGGYYYLYGPTNLWGIVRFTAPADFELRCVYLQMSNPNGSVDGVTVYIYGADGAGNPENVISGPYDVNGPLWLGYAWLDVELDAPFPEFSPGEDFFVVFGPAPMGAATEGWFLYEDAYGNTESRSGYSTGYEGPWSFTLSGDLIVRAGGQIAAFTDLSLTSCFNDRQQFFLNVSEPVVYQAEIENTGSLTVTNYRVVWNVRNESGVTVFADSVDGGALPVGTSTQLSCPHVWITGSAGAYCVTATVFNDDDLSNDNDTALLEQHVGTLGLSWFSYDDGVHNSSVTAPLGMGWGNRFDPPCYPVKVESVQVSIAADVPSSDVRIVNINGFSVTELWNYTGPLQEGSNTLDISREEIYVYGGGIGVGYLYQPGGAIWKDDDPPLAASNPNMPAAAYQIAGSSWTPMESGDWMLRVFCRSATGVTFPSNPQRVNQFLLLGNYPNPFNPTTVISFQLPVAGRVMLEVFDIYGRLLSPGSGAPNRAQATPITEYFPAGMNEISFDGAGLASGVYIYRLTAGKFTASGKMVLIR